MPSETASEGGDVEALLDEVEGMMLEIDSNVLESEATAVVRPTALVSAYIAPYMRKGYIYRFPCYTLFGV